MPEGLSATEVGKEIGEHAKHADGHTERIRRDRLISIAEALLLSIVTITAAWSGHPAAKWGTEVVALKLAKASATRTKANRYFQARAYLPHRGRAPFNAAFGAYIARQQGRHARGREGLSASVPGRLRRAACDPPIHEPERAAGREGRCRSTNRSGRPFRVRSTGRRPRSTLEGESAAGTGDQICTRHRGPWRAALFLIGISTQFSTSGCAVRYGLLGTGALPHRSPRPNRSSRCQARREASERARLVALWDPTVIRHPRGLAAWRACASGTRA